VPVWKQRDHFRNESTIHGIASYFDHSLYAFTFLLRYLIWNRLSLLVSVFTLKPSSSCYLEFSEFQNINERKWRTIVLFLVLHIRTKYLHLVLFVLALINEYIHSLIELSSLHRRLCTSNKSINKLIESTTISQPPIHAPVIAYHLKINNGDR
jgi:hypothetical protein